MKNTKIKSKILSGILTLCMVVGMLPVNAFAENTAPTNSEIITAVATPDIAVQEIAVGSGDVPTLPDALTATLSTNAEISVAVQWTLPDDETFSATEAKNFTYTAKLTENTYTVSSEIVMPTFTVKVVEAQNTLQAAPPATTKIISSITEPDLIEIAINDTRTEADIKATFPTSLSAMVKGEEDALEVPVSGWTLDFSSHSSGAFATDENAEIFYKPILAIPEGYARSNETAQPSLKVQVGEALLHTPQLASTGAGAESFSFEVTVDAGDTFYIPLSGGSGTNPIAPTYSKPYNWSISWGDTITEVWYNGVADPGGANLGVGNASNSDGIPHAYVNAGTYTITITNNKKDEDNLADNDAWLAAFGFENDSGAANSSTNKEMVTAIISGFTPQMTRTQAQITSDTPQIHYEWADAFHSCTNLTGIGPGFSSGWESVKAIGNHFASFMFRNCSSLTSMGSTFTMPQSNALTTIGNYFASSMFAGCSELTSMGSTFTMPQSNALTTIGNYFANSMFLSCSKLTSMGSTFTMPQSAALTTIGDGFASSMFSACSELTGMGSVFNLPKSDALTTIGNSFASSMFFGCIKLASMGSAFTMPQSDALTTIGDDFAYYMFEGCSELTGVGNVFNMPQSPVLKKIGYGFASSMFRDCIKFTSMGDSFNLPQSSVLESIGNDFASYMFSGCSELTSMGSAFTMPQSSVLETIGNNFAYYMFNKCIKLTSMGSVFNMPQSDALTAIGDGFASSMFNACSKLTSMGSAFTMPQSRMLKSIGNNFANSMFLSCSELTSMGSVFNMPQSAVLETIGNDFASSMFNDCSKLTSMGSAFTMPQSPVLTKIGAYFANSMFNNCSELTSMGSAFTMPQSPVLKEIGNDFASSMFNNCSELTSMGSAFTMPQSSVLETIGNNFAYNMFYNCSKLTSMGSAFNMPQSGALTAIGTDFASYMFHGCSELTSMGSVFNMPQSNALTTIGTDFAYYMFYNCSALESMGNSFNMPQSNALTTIGTGFADSMFGNAGSAVTPLVINNEFRFTKLADDQLNKDKVFYNVFNGATLAAGQSRSAQSIINGNETPSTERGTFTGQGNVFFDWNIIPTNWGGGNSGANFYVTFATSNGVTATYMPPVQGVISGDPTGKPATPTAVGYIFDGWYKDSNFTMEYDFSNNVSGSLTLYAKWIGTATDITAFTIPNQVGVATINATNHTVEIKMPYGTNKGGLTPAITLSSGATVSPTSGISQNFTSPITYTVTAEDGTTQDWTVTVTVLPKVATPVISPNGGGFDTSVSVSITSTTSTADIRYTTDGSTPTTTNGTPYTVPFSVTADTTVKAIAVSTDMTDSDVATATFTENTYTTTVTNGTASPTTAVAKDTVVTITATIPSDKEFVNWTVNSGSVALTNINSASTTFTMGTQNVSVTANLVDKPTITRITVSPLSTTVQKGTTQQFTAAVEGTGAFDSGVTWSLDSSYAAATTINSATGLLDVDPGETAATITVIATSVEDGTTTSTAVVTVSDTPVVKHTITPSAGVNGTISPNAQQEISTGGSITFIFAPNIGYEVDNVTVDGSVVTPTTATSYTITNVQNAMTINVTFKVATHNIVSGKDQTVQQGENPSFTSDAEYANLQRVEVDGNPLIRGTDYIDREGSTIITLQGSYTSTLAPGVHTIGIISTTGTATAQFTITAQATSTQTTPTTPADPAISPLTGLANSQTGDSTNTPLLIAFSALGLTTLLLTRKKRLFIRKK